VTQDKPYNPLQKRHLAESVVRAILAQPARQMTETADLRGSGVYILYYFGNSPLYSPLARLNHNGALEQPIYIGKAIPKGGRKGGFADDEQGAVRGTALRDRLGQHFVSISNARNLDHRDFRFRALVVDDIFIPLGENMLIEKYKPVWNLVIDGFGNKDPGRRRKDQYRSPWDVLHPGREFAEKLGENPIPAISFAESLKTFFGTGKIVKPKKPAFAKGSEQTEDDDEER